MLKSLEGGVIVVTGPFKVNGVPIRRVNARYVIATSTKIDIGSVDVAKFDDKYFAREKEEKKSKDEEFFKDGNKEVRTWTCLSLEIRKNKERKKRKKDKNY